MTTRNDIRQAVKEMGFNSLSAMSNGDKAELANKLRSEIASQKVKVKYTSGNYHTLDLEKEVAILKAEGVPKGTKALWGLLDNNFSNVEISPDKKGVIGQAELKSKLFALLKPSLSEKLTLAGIEKIVGKKVSFSHEPGDVEEHVWNNIKDSEKFAIKLVKAGFKAVKGVSGMQSGDVATLKGPNKWYVFVNEEDATAAQN